MATTKKEYAEHGGMIAADRADGSTSTSTEPGALDGSEPGATESREVRALRAELARRIAIEAELRASLHELGSSEETARRAADALMDFLENAPVPIHSVGPGATIVWANRAELELMGYTADEYIGRPIAAFHADPAVFDDVLARLARGETLRDHEVRVRAKDGSIRHVLLSSNMRERDGQLICSRCFALDITARKRAEEERDAVIADLSRTVRLNDMFAGILGHDLRGPLSTIVMASQLLLGHVQDPRGVRTIQRVLNSAGRMQQMISQLLDFARARMDGGVELERSAIDVSEVARDVVEEVRFACPEWTIEIELRGDMCGDYDRDRLSQVFSNLIGNAVQHGAPETPLHVLIDGSDPASIHVAIRNRGTIPPELVPVLFSPFRGSQQKTGRSQGLGLGLFITDHIVRAHGGQITVESADDTTAFLFQLPRRSCSESSVATFDAADPSPSPDPISDAARRIATLGESSLDETERRTVHEVMQQNEERFRLLIDAVKDYAIFLLDADGYVATWNPGAARIKGYTADEIIGRHFSVFYPPGNRRRTAEELAAARRDGRFEDEGLRVRKDGSTFWANVVITAMHDASGTLVGYVKITRDLTEQRKLEQERVAHAQAQEAVRLRDEFLSLASHELKTPLTVLQLQLEALRDRIGAREHTTRAKLERSARATHRLAELIEALLDVSRIATGRFELNLERGDLAEIVSIAVDRMHEAAAAAGCTLSVVAEKTPGRWDRSRIDQAISNLVSNSIRYAAGRPIEVSVTRDAGGAVIAVRDHGPGIQDGLIPRIFERFERAAPMRHYGGLGLGLYLVRQITEAHGGSVTVNNPEGGGACFSLRLPLGSTDNPMVA